MWQTSTFDVLRIKTGWNNMHVIACSLKLRMFPPHMQCESVLLQWPTGSLPRVCPASYPLALGMAWIGPLLPEPVWLPEPAVAGVRGVSKWPVARPPDRSFSQCQPPEWLCLCCWSSSQPRDLKISCSQLWSSGLVSFGSVGKHGGYGHSKCSHPVVRVFEPLNFL